MNINVHKNLVKFGRAVFELCEWTETDRQTDRHTHRNSRSMDLYAAAKLDDNKSHYNDDNNISPARQVHQCQSQHKTTQSTAIKAK